MLALSFLNWTWLWPLVAVLVVTAVLAVGSARRAPPGVARWLCPALKVVGLALLGYCLLEPMATGQRARPGANLLAVVADNSEGLKLKDARETRTRGELLQVLLTSSSADWLHQLENDYDVRRYYFDSRLHPTEDFAELSFDGRASAIGGALGDVAARLSGRPVAGIILLTDGNATDMRAASELPNLPPVFPVTIGKAEPVRDIALEQVRCTQTDFEDAPVSIQADVSAAGYAGQMLSARLFDATAKQVAEQSLRASSRAERLTFRFQFRPEKQGLSFYRVEVGARDADPARPEEATLANNSRVVAVNRGQGPYRILYVAGRPNWEYKFLNRALDADDQIQLVGLIRVARREPKFNFIGRPGETSNPLFRGFGNQSPEEVEQYDQPVLVRLNTRDEAELHAGFPRTAEELYPYHAVIVDDLEAEFFKPEQSALLQKFVSERGGGFLMLGGMETFREGKYQNTPVGDMLPVYLDAPDEGQPPEGWRMNLTREGALQTWARLRDNEADEKARLLGMPEFQVFNRVREAKPGAMIVATATGPSGKIYPALAVQRFGHGRTAALLIGDFWRWGMHDADSHRDMDKAWRQLMRWLVTDVPNRVDVAVDPSPAPTDASKGNQSVMLRVTARDEKFQPLEDARVTLEVQPALVDSRGQGQELSGVVKTNLQTSAPGIRLQPEASTKEPGVYESGFVPRLPGGYKAVAYATNSAGVEIGRAVTGWSAEPEAEEFRSLQPNTALLEDIARRTGGEVISPEKLSDFARNLPRRQAPVMETWTFPLWHTPLIFALAMACLISDWGLRRWKGLP